MINKDLNVLAEKWLERVKQGKIDIDTADIMLDAGISPEEYDEDMSFILDISGKYLHPSRKL